MASEARRGCPVCSVPSPAQKHLCGGAVQVDSRLWFVAIFCFQAAAKRLEWANEIAREAAAPRRARAGGASAPQMPDPATLLGSRIEMIMRCEIPTSDGPVVDLYLCPGTVKRVVCGGKLKVGRKTYTHEWVYVEWDGEEPLNERVWWQHLRQSFFEKNK